MKTGIFTVWGEHTVCDSQTVFAKYFETGLRHPNLMMLRALEMQRCTVYRPDNLCHKSI